MKFLSCKEFYNIEVEILCVLNWREIEEEGERREESSVFTNETIPFPQIIRFSVPSPYSFPRRERGSGRTNVNPRIGGGFRKDVEHVNKFFSVPQKASKCVFYIQDLY